MKPLAHPAIEDITVEGILHAFANPVRVQIYASLLAADCPQCCSVYLQLKDQKLPKSTLSQHFAVLRECGLIRSERRGTELHNVTRCDELDDKFGDMIEAILDAYLHQNVKGKAPKARRKKKA